MSYMNKHPWGGRTKYLAEIRSVLSETTHDRKVKRCVHRGTDFPQIEFAKRSTEGPPRPDLMLTLRTWCRNEVSFEPLRVRLACIQTP